MISTDMHFNAKTCIYTILNSLTRNKGRYDKQIITCLTMYTIYQRI